MRPRQRSSTTAHATWPPAAPAACTLCWCVCGLLLPHAQTASARACLTCAPRCWPMRRGHTCVSTRVPACLIPSPPAGGPHGRGQRRRPGACAPARPARGNAGPVGGAPARAAGGARARARVRARRGGRAAPAAAHEHRGADPPGRGRRGGAGGPGPPAARRRARRPGSGAGVTHNADKAERGHRSPCRSPASAASWSLRRNDALVVVQSMGRVSARATCRPCFDDELGVLVLAVEWHARIAISACEAGAVALPA